MSLLLDTHTLLWHASADPQISSAATALLIDPANELFLSMASLWELAIKVGLGKLVLSTTYSSFIAQAISGYGLVVLPITVDDCVLYEALTFPLKEHRDPFDRLIIAQSKRVGLSIVGADTLFDAYGIVRLW